MIPAIAQTLTQLTSLNLSESLWQADQDFSPLTALADLAELRLEGVELRLDPAAADGAVPKRVPRSLPIAAVEVRLPVPPTVIWDPWAASRTDSEGSEGSRYNPSRTRRGLVAEFVKTWLKPLLEEKLDTVAITYEPCEAELHAAPELLAALGRAGPQLRSLTLVKILVYEQLPVLTPLTQLTQLHLEACGLHNSEVAQLSVLTGLRCLSLVGNTRVRGGAGAMWALAGTLSQLTSLRCHSKAAAAVRKAFGDRIEKEWYPQSYRDHVIQFKLKLPQ
jgi:hypothetical protein